MNETYNHLAEAKALLDLAAQIESEQTSANVASVAQAHAAIAQADRLDRIAVALEKLTGAMSESGKLLDVRVFDANVF